MSITTRSSPHASRRAPPMPTPAGEKHWMEGVALAREGRLDDAATAFERATRLAPSASLYWLNLASVRRRQRRPDEALRCARRAFELDSRSVLACHLLAELLRHRNRAAEALAVLQALHPQAERDAQHLLLEGALQMTLAAWQAAAVTFLKVLALKPAHIEAYQQLGFALANLAQYADASECFRTVSLLEPQLCSAIYSAHYSAWACDWTAVASDAPRLLEAMQWLDAGTATPGFSPFCLLSLSDDATAHRNAAVVAARQVAREARQGGFAGEWQRPEAGLAAYPVAAATARCRIGFVSADFRTHATSILLVQTLERLDRSRFEIALYSHGIDDDSALRHRLIAAVDDFVECGAMSTAEQAARIRADGVSILVDMSGFTASARMGVFALRPAPVQVLWLAYPSTTGSDFIDYVIGDPVLTPLEHAEDFSEKIAQLPVCYEPTDELREHPEASTRLEAGLPEGAFVYACFNQSYKITEPVFARWCRILQRVPNSVLWLLVPQAHIQAALRKQAVARGIAPERVLFAPFVNPSQHLARLPLADLFLDTFPYGAHTTCSDALWMGLPVLTQVGRSFSARVAASLLSAVGLSELAVSTEAEYENFAVLLANDPQAMHDIRKHLADNRLALPLFDSQRFTRELGDLFGRMHSRWQQGLPVEALPALAEAAAEPVVAETVVAQPAAPVVAEPRDAAPRAAASNQAAATNHQYWANCADTHVAVGPYYRRVNAFLPVLCDLYLKPEHTALDVGCGNGEYTEVIAKRCAAVRAFDLSPKLIDRARRRGVQNIDYRTGDIDSLADHRDTRFDAVFVMGVFVTIHGDRFEQAAAELAQLVRPGGLLITRDSVTAGADVVRHVTDGYIAHYRNADHFFGGIEAAGFMLERSVYLDTFNDLTNSFYVFRRC